MRLMKVYEIEEMPYEVQSAVINHIGKTTADEYIEWTAGSVGEEIDKQYGPIVDKYLLDNGSDIYENILIRQCH